MIENKGEYTEEMAFGADIVQPLHEKAKPENADILVENYTKLAKLKPETYSFLKEFVAKTGIVGDPMEVIVCYEKGGRLRTKQLMTALELAMRKLMEDTKFPQRHIRTDFPDGKGYNTSSQSSIIVSTGPILNTTIDSNRSIKDPLLVLTKNEGISEPEYLQARARLIQEANNILEIFNVEKIPTTHYADIQVEL